MNGRSTTNRRLAAAATAALLFGAGLGFAASGPDLSIVRDKPSREAGFAMLADMRRLAGKDTSAVVATARIYYLVGEQATAEAMLEPVLKKSDSGDLQDIGEMYAEAGETARADAIFRRVLAAEPKDDWGQIEMAAWYLRLGLRDQGEVLIARALARSPDRAKHYLRTGEGYLGVPWGR